MTYITLVIFLIELALDFFNKLIRQIVNNHAPKKD